MIRFTPDRFVVAQAMNRNDPPVVGRVDVISNNVTSGHVYVFPNAGGNIRCRPEAVEYIGTGKSFVRFAQWAQELCQDERLALKRNGNVGHYLIYSITYLGDNAVHGYAVRLEDNQIFSLSMTEMEKIGK